MRIGPAMQAWDYFFLCSKQFLLPCNPTAAQNEAVGEKQRGHHLAALQGLPLQEQNKKCSVNLFCGCQTLLLQDSQPCYTTALLHPQRKHQQHVWCPQVHPCNCQHQAPCPGTDIQPGAFLAQLSALTGHCFSLLHLTGSKLSKRGRSVPFSSFPFMPGQHILKGTA